MKEDNINEEANNIELKAVMSPSNENENNSPQVAPEQEDDVDVRLVCILYKVNKKLCDFIISLVTLL